MSRSARLYDCVYQENHTRRKMGIECRFQNNNSYILTGKVHFPPYFSPPHNISDNIETQNVDYNHLVIYTYKLQKEQRHDPSVLHALYILFFSKHFPSFIQNDKHPITNQLHPFVLLQLFRQLTS